MLKRKINTDFLQFVFFFIQYSECTVVQFIVVTNLDKTYTIIHILPTGIAKVLQSCQNTFFQASID